MLSCEQTLKKHKLINKEEIIGVACSGGADSMALLHFLNSKKEDLDIEVVAINVNHNIRAESDKDSQFVADYCKQEHIKCYKFNIDVFKLMQEKKYTLEEAARVARYAMFDSLLSRKIVDKIALGHHVSDQAETVLLNIFRGTGLQGASGMGYTRDKYIRPLLATTKQEILAYDMENEIPYVEDETNFESDASRNFLRNDIMPLIKSRWPNVEQNIFSFANICRSDDTYIKKQMSFDGVIKDKDLVKIPLTYFVYSDSVVTRLILSCLEYLKIQKDFEKKHLDIIKNLATNLENGSKVNLPNNTTAFKEYDFLTIVTKPVIVKTGEWKFKCGKTVIENFTIIVKRATQLNIEDGSLLIDAKKLPKTAVWRFRQDGDIITKFGGGTKKLKSYLVDKKVPLRLRDSIPVLADGNEIFAIAGIDISEKVKIDATTTSAYVLTCEQTSK